MPNILAIDQGTSSTKALVVSDAGVLGEGYASVNPEAKGGGTVEQDPEELLQSIIDAGRAALAAAGTPVWTPWGSPTRARPCCAGIVKPGSRWVPR